MKKFLNWAKQTAQQGSTNDAVMEIVGGVIGLIIVEAFISPTVLTQTDAAATLAKVALPLLMIAVICYGVFNFMKAKKGR